MPIGSIVVPVCGSSLGSYRVTGSPKKELLWSLWISSRFLVEDYVGLRPKTPKALNPKP